LGKTLKEIMASAFGSYFGPGSEPAQTLPFRNQFPDIVRDYGIKSVADAGCGKGWIREECEKLDVAWSGFDINQRKDAILFDITEEVLPGVDLIICRDVLFHLTNELVENTLNNFRTSGSRYLLATSCYDIDNTERPTSFDAGVINSKLDLVPMLGEPLTKIEEPMDYRYMGLWEL